MTKTARPATAHPPTPVSGPAPAPVAAPATVYTIEPTNPDEYYVPIYDPGVVYGAWPYPAYTPFYWYPPGYVAAASFAFAGRVAVGAAIWGTIAWSRYSVGINPLRYSRFTHTSVTRTTNLKRHLPIDMKSLPNRATRETTVLTPDGVASSRSGWRSRRQAR